MRQIPKNEIAKPYLHFNFDNILMIMQFPPSEFI